MLCDINPHPRDSRVRFVEDTHVYYVDGSCEGYVSCTTFIHKLFDQFDADKIIAKMMNSKNWPASAYYGMTPDEIKAQWDANRDAAATAGTLMHANIENYYNGLEHDETSKEWQLFCKFKEDHKTLIPYRSEMIVFAEDLKIAGSIDMLFVVPSDPDGYIIADWKRSKQIKHENRWQKGTHPITADLDDTNHNHYSLQLAIYKYLLQNYYGMRINGAFLVVLHPRQDTYMRIDVKNLDDRVEAIMRERRTEIQCSVDRPSKKQRTSKDDNDADSKKNVPPANA
jgi:hypothetical protein